MHAVHIHTLRSYPIGSAPVDAQCQDHEHCEGTDRSEEMQFALHTHGQLIAHHGRMLKRRLETWCSRKMHAPASGSQAI